ncbi:MAG TPA: FtsW/RodA/SpoVE family cell cycle protein, partial [Bryobacteraceae bacterium]
MRNLSIRDLDWPLLLITMVICGVGVLQIYSATMDTEFHGAWWKQIIYILGGLVLMWMILAPDYHAILHYVPMLFIGSVIALLVTYVIGDSAFGSKRWIPLPGGLHLQVSEFIKLVIILLVARYLTEYVKSDELEIREMLILSGLVVVPAFLVFKQPDLGTALTYVSVLVVGAFIAGLRWKYVAVIAVLTVVVLPVSYQFLKDYQKARLVGFMDPDRDPQGTGYQLVQSKIAVGSGSMFGKGVTKGTQTQLRFL